MVFGFLLKEGGDAGAGVADFAAEVLEFGFGLLVLDIADAFNDELLQAGEGSGEGVVDEVGLTDAVFAAFFEVGTGADALEEGLDFIDERGDFADGVGAAEDLEDALCGSWDCRGAGGRSGGRIGRRRGRFVSRRPVRRCGLRRR